MSNSQWNNYSDNKNLNHLNNPVALPPLQPSINMQSLPFPALPNSGMGNLGAIGSGNSYPQYPHQQYHSLFQSPLQFPPLQMTLNNSQRQTQPQPYSTQDFLLQLSQLQYPPPTNAHTHNNQINNNTPSPSVISPPTRSVPPNQGFPSPLSPPQSPSPPPAALLPFLHSLLSTPSAERQPSPSPSPPLSRSQTISSPSSPTTPSIPTTFAPSVSSTSATSSSPTGKGPNTTSNLASILASHNFNDSSLIDDMLVILAAMEVLKEHENGLSINDLLKKVLALIGMSLAAFKRKYQSDFLSWLERTPKYFTFIKGEKSERSDKGGEVAVSLVPPSLSNLPVIGKKKKQSIIFIMGKWMESKNGAPPSISQFVGLCATDFVRVDLAKLTHELKLPSPSQTIQWLLSNEVEIRWVEGKEEKGEGKGKVKRVFPKEAPPSSDGSEQSSSSSRPPPGFSLDLSGSNIFKSSFNNNKNYKHDEHGVPALNRDFSISFNDLGQPVYGESANAKLKQPKVEPKTDVELRQVLQCLPHSFLIPVMERAVAAHSPLFEIIFENGRDAILRFADKTELTLDSVDVNINEVVAKFYAARKESESPPSTTDNVKHPLKTSTNGTANDTLTSGRPNTMRVNSKMLSYVVWTPTTSNDVYSFTYRIERFIAGGADMVSDVVAAVLGKQPKSVLLLGSPGAGKTTLLCEIARLISTSSSRKKGVLVIDTANRLAGDDVITHPRIGLSRRIPANNLPSHVRIRAAAQDNHPDVMVMDEVETIEEARELRAAAQRGITLVVCASCTELRKFVFNSELNILVGGIIGNGSHLFRKESPSFDMAIEVSKFQSWKIHHNVSETVDAILQEKPYSIEKRWVAKKTSTILARSEIVAATKSDNPLKREGGVLRPRSATWEGEEWKDEERMLEELEIQLGERQAITEKIISDMKENIRRTKTA